MGYSPEAAQRIHVALKQRGWTAYETNRGEIERLSLVVPRGDSQLTAQEIYQLSSWSELREYLF